MRLALLMAVFVACCLPAVTQAQSDEPDAEQAEREPQESLGEELAEDDDEARLLFQVGVRAFEAARFDEALGHFQRAYELSGRVGLLYNIGVAADRLRRDDEALAAFEQFISGAPEGSPRLEDAHARVEVLRTHGQTSGRGAVSIIGPLLVGVAGLGLLAVPIVGALTTDDCSRLDGGVCVEERSLDGAWAGVYTGVGVLAVAGAVVWFLLSGSDDSEARVVARPGGAGLTVSF